jgi:hypothetical protein
MLRSASLSGLSVCFAYIIPAGIIAYPSPLR